MTVFIKKLMAFAFSVVLGLGLTSAVLWVFAIEVSPIDRWAEFPGGWRIMDLVTNSMALLMVFGIARASYRVLHELWIKDSQSGSPPPLPPTKDL
ncbi:MAG: hypothetical protein HQ501_11820 [Rhodospirillales bacterium]|nr:hypothetical protein [Rhodospirillales bacterium]